MPAELHEEPLLIDEKEAAKIIGVRVTWLQRARTRGNGPPFVSLGRMRKYNRKKLLAWLDSKESTITSA